MTTIDNQIKVFFVISFTILLLVVVSFFFIHMGSITPSFVVAARSNSTSTNSTFPVTNVTLDPNDMPAGGKITFVGSNDTGGQILPIQPQNQPTGDIGNGGDNSGGHNNNNNNNNKKHHSSDDNTSNLIKHMNNMRDLNDQISLQKTISKSGGTPISLDKFGVRSFANATGNYFMINFTAETGNYGYVVKR